MITINSPRDRAARPRVLVTFGTRPEAIKLAPVVLGLHALDREFEVVLCSTGQHRELLDQSLEAFGLRPDLDLGLMRPGQSLIDLSSRALKKLDAAVRSVRPDVVLVQGDTTSAMAAALAAYLLQVPVGHVEAGLRTGDLYQPFPEEGNRRIVGTLASMHFAPTLTAARRLEREHVPSRDVYVTGNTVIDALLYTKGRQIPRARDRRSSRRRLLVTLHRRESLGRPLQELCRAILAIVVRNPDIEVVFPVHASPLVREPVYQILGAHPRIELCTPLGYAEFVALLDTCYLVLTDSGGIQEEAPALGKPVLVLRNKTERFEGIEAGTARLVGTNPQRVVEATERLLLNEDEYRAMATAPNPYGDGHAAERIVQALRYHFGLSPDRPVGFTAVAQLRPTTPVPA